MIKEGSEEVSFDGKRVRLTQRAFKLLLLLAKAVHGGAGSLATATIKDGLVARSASDTAVFDAVRYLRNQLTEQLGPAIDAFELIRNHSRLWILLGSGARGNPDPSHSDQ